MKRFRPIVSAVWRSNLPEFLIRGLAGKLAALADDDGRFNQPGKPRLTLNYLILHCRYGESKPRRLCRQTIKNQLSALVRCGFVRIIDTGPGRGHYRTYTLHPEALATVQDPADPMLRPAHRRVGKGAEGRILVTIRKNWKGDNKGPTEAETPEISPDLHENAQPPPIVSLAGPIGQSPRRRWDAVRSPSQNFKVFVRLADRLCVEVLAAGQAQLAEGDMITLFKNRVASLMPGQLQHTAQVLSALDAAVYRRRMKGLPVPANVGSNGQHAFSQDRSRHAHRMDAR